MRSLPARVAGLLLAIVLIAACQSTPEPPTAPEEPVAPPAASEPPPAAAEQPRLALPPAAEARPQLRPLPSGELPVRVGLLLPLSGDSAALGNAMLDVAMLALFDVAGERLTLLPRDTGGTAEGAAAAAAEVLSEGATLILGPLFAHSVSAVAPLAQARGVNVIAFSTNRAVAGNGVYLIGFAPGQQVERIVRYAAGRGLSRLAILAPETPYGTTVAQAAEAAAPAAGMAVVQTEYYPADGQGADAPIRRLAQRQRLDRFDALLLPEGGGALRAIAPLLPYHDVDTGAARLLGTGLWDDPQLAREPTLIGGWFAGPPPETGQAFLDRYRQVYGRRAPRLVSVAYDAVALAAVLAGDVGPPRYDAAAIGNPSGFAGIDGIFRFGPDGVAERGLAVIEVTRSGPRVLDPAPQSFADLLN